MFNQEKTLFFTYIKVIIITIFWEKAKAKNLECPKTKIKKSKRQPEVNIFDLLRSPKCVLTISHTTIFK